MTNICMPLGQHQGRLEAALVTVRLFSAAESWHVSLVESQDMYSELKAPSAEVSIFSMDPILTEPNADEFVLPSRKSKAEQNNTSSFKGCGKGRQFQKSRSKGPKGGGCKVQMGREKTTHGKRKSQPNKEVWMDRITADAQSKS